MNVTAQNTIYPINMFDSSGTQELRQSTDSQALVPATEANEKTTNGPKSQDSFNSATTKQANPAINSNEKDEETRAEQEADAEMVEELKARDKEVRAHELAHAIVGGQYAGAPTYEYQYGPDGRSYAVGGEVQIDISKESTPEKTLQKMEQVVASAMAPQEPSAQDVRVANQARQIAAEARSDLSAEKAAPSETRKGEQNASKARPVIHQHRESLQQETLASEAVSESVGLASTSEPVSRSVGLASESQPVSVSVGLASESQPVSESVGLASERQSVSTTLASRYNNIQVDVGSQFSQQI